MMVAGSLARVVSTLLGDPRQEYTPQSDVLMYLTMAAQQISQRSRCLYRHGSYPLAKGQYAYALPSDFLYMDAVRLLASGGQLLPAKRTRFENVVTAASSVYGWGGPLVFDILENAAWEKYAGSFRLALPAHEGDDPSLRRGKTEADSSALPNRLLVEGSHWIVEGDLITGASDGDDDGEVVSVTAVQILTDDSTDPVTTVPGMDIVYAGIDGGLSVGEEVRIRSAAAPLKSLAVAPTPSRSDADGMESLHIYYAYEHAELTKSTDVLALPVEFETALIHRTIYWIRYSELGGEDGATEIANRDFEREYHSAQPRVANRVKDAMNRWEEDLRFSAAPSTEYEIEGSGPLSPLVRYLIR